jgi:ribose transport system substrate-binding protein
MQKMKKRVALLSVFLMLCFMLSACSSSGKTTANTNVKKAPYTIGYDIYFVGNSWSVQLYNEFKVYAATKTSQIKQVDYVESEGDINKQIANIDDLISKKVDAIITTPNSPTALSPVLEKARNKGIKVVLLGAKVNSANAYDSMVTVDDTAWGKAGAEWLVKQLNGKGNIFVLNGMAGVSVSTDRWNGAKGVFDQNKGIKIVASQNCNWDYATAKTAVSSMLAANPQVDGVWSQGGDMTRAALDDFQAAKRKLVPMTGEDNNGFLKEWKTLQPQGFTSIACSKPTWMADNALDDAFDLLQGKTVQKDQYIAVPTITDANLNQFVKPNLPDSFYANTHLTDSQINAIFK